MFDEPWKSAFESVGPHWGLFDGDGRPKFSSPFPWKPDWGPEVSRTIGSCRPAA